MPTLREHVLVQDIPENIVLNLFDLRIEFPTELFPLPDFPRSTILTSLRGKEKSSEDDSPIDR